VRIAAPQGTAWLLTDPCCPTSGSPSLVWQRTDGTAWFVTQAGLIAYIGFNDAGIGLCLNSLPAPSRPLGVPHYFTVREMFEASSLADVVHAVERAERAIPARADAVVGSARLSFGPSAPVRAADAPRAGADAAGALQATGTKESAAQATATNAHSRTTC
jgi:hypothetical protein